jgi:hypothetical protein
VEGISFSVKKQVSCQGMAFGRDALIEGFDFRADRRMKNKAPPRKFKREPDDHRNQQINEVSEQPLPEGGE